MGYYIDLPSTQANETGPAGTVISEVLKSMQVLSGEPRTVAFSSSTALEFLNPSSVDALALIALPILSAVFLSLAAEAVNANIIFGPVIGPHAIVVKIPLKQFCALLKEVVSTLL